MSFIPGETFIPASGQVIGDKEKDYMHDAVDKGFSWNKAHTGVACGG